MKPHRIKMAHNLILNYGLDRKMDVLVRAIARPPSGPAELTFAPPSPAPAAPATLVAA